jgi:hypothetical protein
MAELMATKTRLALLAAVADGQVYKGTWYSVEDYWDDNGSYDRRVTARVAELHRAGWVAMDHSRDPDRPHRRLWRLTDAGRAVLAANKETAS